jgi:hypothetical protein
MPTEHIDYRYLEVAVRLQSIVFGSYQYADAGVFEVITEYFGAIWRAVGDNVFRAHRIMISFELFS